MFFPKLPIVIKILILFLAVSVLYFSLAPSVHAQDAGKSDSFLKGIGKYIGAPAVAIVAAFLWVIQQVLLYLLYYLGVGLDNLFRWNVEFTPAAWGAVQLGWTTLRDIANSFFILIVLWIAITIIFGIERLGGKKLLFRVIAVALLINFSLAFVATIFGFSNIFADAFYQKFPRSEVEIDGQKVQVLAVSAYIRNTLQMNTIFTPLSAEDAKKGAEKQQRQAQQQINLRGENPSKFAYAEALGIQQTQGFAFIPILIFLAKAGLVVAAVNWVTGGGLSNLVGDTYTLAYKTAITDLFLLIVVAVFAIICVMMILRVIAITILSIIAPAAFFLYAIPGQIGDTYFKKWVDALLRWSFFLPAFFFLFYIALYILGAGYTQFQQAGVERVNAAASPEHFMMLLMSAAFMIASVKVAKMIAGSSADMAMSFATKMGTLALGAATGGVAALAVAPAVRRFAPQITKGTEALSQRPVLGKITAPITRKVDQYVLEQKAKALEQKKGLEHASGAMAVTEYRRSFGRQGKVAAALATIDKNSFKDLTPQEQQEAFQILSQVGFAKEALKHAPHLATEQNVENAHNRREAIEKTVRGVDDKSTISDAAYDDNEVLHAVIMNTKSQKELGQLARKDYGKFQKVMNYYRTNLQELGESFDELDRQVPGRGTELRQAIERYDTAHPGRVRQRRQGRQGQQQTAQGPQQPVAPGPRIERPSPGAGETNQQEYEDRQRMREEMARERERIQREREGNNT